MFLVGPHSTDDQIGKRWLAHVGSKFVPIFTLIASDMILLDLYFHVRYLIPNSLVARRIAAADLNVPATVVNEPQVDICFRRLTAPLRSLPQLFGHRQKAIR